MFSFYCVCFLLILNGIRAEEEDNVQVTINPNNENNKNVTKTAREYKNRNIN